MKTIASFLDQLPETEITDAMAGMLITNHQEKLLMKVSKMWNDSLTRAFETFTIADYSIPSLETASLNQLQPSSVDAIGITGPNYVGLKESKNNLMLKLPLEPVLKVTTRHPNDDEIDGIDAYFYKNSIRKKSTFLSTLSINGDRPITHSYRPGWNHTATTENAVNSALISESIPIFEDTPANILKISQYIEEQGKNPLLVYTLPQQPIFFTLLARFINRFDENFAFHNVPHRVLDRALGAHQVKKFDQCLDILQRGLVPVVFSVNTESNSFVEELKTKLKLYES